MDGCKPQLYIWGIHTINTSKTHTVTPIYNTPRHAHASKTHFTTTHKTHAKNQNNNKVTLQNSSRTIVARNRVSCGEEISSPCMLLPRGLAKMKDNKVSGGPNRMQYVEGVVVD